MEGLTEEQQAALALDLNLARRQLTPEQVRALVTAGRGEKADRGAGRRKDDWTNVPSSERPMTRKEADAAEAAVTGKTEAATTKARQRREAKAAGKTPKPKAKPKRTRIRRMVDHARRLACTC